MHTNNRVYLIVLSILFLNLLAKGQTSINVMNHDSISMPYLCVSNDQIFPLFDSICYHWENSPLKSILSYATVVPHKNSNNDTIWHIRVEQLYDFEVFSLIFPSGGLDFAKLFIPYGLVNQNNRNIFVGIENTKSDYENNISRQIVENFFRKDTNCAIFTRDFLDHEICKTEYLKQSDTISSSNFFPELFIYHNYTAIILDYVEENKSFVLLRKDIVKSPWQ